MIGRIIPCAVLAFALAVSSTAQQAAKDKPRENKAEQSGAQKGKLKLVDLNTATEAELRQIPGVDKEMAKKIMDNRPYVSVEDLARSGISVEVRENAAMRVTVTSQAPKGESKPAREKQ